ncbi:hypothetical protein BH24BAC1_BH24BAC1_34820 [soil metagenome]
MVKWVVVFRRREYAEMVAESLNNCHREKDLLVHARYLICNYRLLIEMVRMDNFF